MKEKQDDILLVEDRAEDAELCMMSLKEDSRIKSIKWVKDGQEALDYLFAKNKYTYRKEALLPRFILLDLNMPKVGGLEVLKQLRSHKTTKTIPVVILTTSKDQYDISNAYNLGANSYVLKPVGFDDFLNSVKKVGIYWLFINEIPPTIGINKI